MAEINKKINGFPSNIELVSPFEKKIEFLLAILILPILAISLFFLSGNITGNAIADISYDTSFSVGGILFILGLVLSFFYFRIKV
jgi:hypothetical protein